MKFTIDAMTLHFYSIPIKTPFRISAGIISDKNALLGEKVPAKPGDAPGELFFIE